MVDLATITDRLGSLPRHFGLYERLTYLRVRRPDWALRDPLNRFFDQFLPVLRTGRVCWGYTIQANSALFAAGTFNAPGEVLYIADPAAESCPNLMQHLANTIYGLKGTKPDDPALASIGDYLANERIRVFGQRVPAKLAGPAEFRISTVFFVREHLPNRILSLPFYPIAVDPNGLAVVVPSKYWPESLRRAWCEAS